MRNPFRKRARLHALAAYECKGQLGHAWVFMRPFPPPRRGNLICSGEPAFLRCTRCGGRRTIGMQLDMRAAMRRFRAFREGRKPCE